MSLNVIFSKAFWFHLIKVEAIFDMFRKLVWTFEQITKNIRKCAFSWYAKKYCDSVWSYEKIKLKIQKLKLFLKLKVCQKCNL